MDEQDEIRRFEAVVLPHLNAAYNLARWLTRHEQDAEDVVQEAYLRAFKFFDSFRGEHGRAWLLRIVRNTCYTWRQQTRKDELNSPLDDETRDLELQSMHLSDDGPESTASRRDDAKILNEALMKLPVEFREAVVLKDLEDFSYKEIAEIMAVPIGTIMSRLARGRRLLQTNLTQVKKVERDAM